MKKVIFLCLTVLFLWPFIESCEATEETEVQLEKIVVTPARIPEKESKTTSNVTVIGTDTIEASNAKYVSDILKEEAGLNIYDSSTSKTVKVDIRGFADTSVSNILVLIDGRKVNSIDISGPDWLQIPLETVERIEVLRGAGSVLYGDNAVGGVINIITKKGRGKPSFVSSAKYGSFNMRQEDVEMSGSVDKMSYYLYAKYFDTQGYRSNSDVLTKDFNTRISYSTSENLSFDISSGWHKDDYGMPGGLNDAGELTQYGRRGSANENDYASTKDRFVKLTMDAKPWPDCAGLGTINVDIFYRNRDAYSWFDYGTWGATATKYMIDTQGMNAKYMNKKRFCGRNLNLVAGIDYYDVEHIIKGSGNGVMASTDDLTIYKKELGFYTYSDYQLTEKLVVNGGGRYQKADYRFDQRAASVRYETRNPSETVFMGGVKYEYAKGCNVYFNVQETFRFLATDEWYDTNTGLNTDLKHQTGIQYEGGIRHNFSHGIELSITPYWIDLENEIWFDPYIVTFGKNHNYDRTRRKGVEVVLNTDLKKLIGFSGDSLLDNLIFNINYTYQQAKFKSGDYAGNEMPMVPRNLFNAQLRGGILKKYDIALLCKYVDERYAINDVRHERRRLKHYFVVDGKITYKKGQFEAFCGVNNIFNQRYYIYAVKSATSSLIDYYPAPERNFEVGIKYRF